MPEMDGIELSKKIKLNSATSHIPMIILTAKSAAKDKMEGYETGADEYIIKPYDEDFLKTTMAKFVDSKSAPELHYEEVDVSLIKPRKRDYSKSKS